jgi:hypothetical protein
MVLSGFPSVAAVYPYTPNSKEAHYSICSCVAPKVMKRIT